jgi:hypothetical protein
MLTLIEGLPPDVVGIQAVGKVTHDDYQQVLIPKAEALIAKGPIRFLYVFTSNFEGFEIGALWDDGAFGIKHWRAFSRIAVVGDQTWLHAAIAIFKPLFPCEARLFRLADLPAAKRWISNSDIIALAGECM